MRAAAVTANGGVDGLAAADTGDAVAFDGACGGVLAVNGGVWWPGSGRCGRGGAVTIGGGVRRRVSDDSGVWRPSSGRRGRRRSAYPGIRRDKKGKKRRKEKNKRKRK